MHLLLGVSWNLFLAALPVLFGYWLARVLQRRQQPLPWAQCLLLGVAWLGFLPNAPYLLTEWRHLLFDERWAQLREAGNEDHVAMFHMAVWALGFFLYSAAGVVCFVLAIRPLDRTLRRNGQRTVWYAPALFFLTSLGVYLGLILRWNTWDLITRPHRVVDSALEAFTSAPLLGAILVFALILWALYAGLALLLDALTLRLANSEPDGGLSATYANAYPVPERAASRPERAAAGERNAP